MSNQLTNNAEALRLFLTEDIYVIGQPAAISTAQDLVAPPVETTLQQQAVPVQQLPVSVVEEPAVPFKKGFDFKYKGKNQKGILILVNDEANDLSNADGVALLTKLMVAIKVTGADVALINYAKYTGATYTDFYNALNCNIILSFGVTNNELQVPNIPLHGIADYQASKIVITQQLHVLATDEIAKRQLWNTLKTLI